MSVSMKDLDPALQGAGQKAGIEIWRIRNFQPVQVPNSSHGKFFTGGSYVILKTTALKSGALCHDLHYWLGKDTTQDEAVTAAIKMVELDAALGSRAVQYREVQGYESEKFLSYFKPCIIPREDGVASGFKHVKAEENQNRLYVCKGKHVVNVKEVPFARSSLNHDDIFILDTKSKIFQFNGSNTSIQERARALEVAQYIKDTYHDGKCEIAPIEDGKLMADAGTGEFWAIFGGFAPLPRKAYTGESKRASVVPSKLYCVEEGEAMPVKADSLTRELLDSSKCYVLDCVMEVFVWVGNSTSLEERKTLISVVNELINSLDRAKSHLVLANEGFETVMFKSKFKSWDESTKRSSSQDGKVKVAELLKRQGVNVRGFVKGKENSPKEEHQSYIDCTGDLEVWRVNGQQKTPLTDSDQSKFYSGDCYIFQYSYPGPEREEYLIGTWFGKKSVERDRAGATSQVTKMVEAMKFFPTQARVHEGSEPVQFFAIFQSILVLKGGLSEGYKKYIAQKKLPDDTYSEDGLALFRVQGSGPEYMQAIQVDPVATSLNSSYCYILHSGSTIFIWSGNSITPDEQELAERQLDVIKPEMQFRFQKEGSESEQFWDLLGGKTEHASHKIPRVSEGDPHLFSCTLSIGDIKVTEVYNFDQDDLMTEDIYILHCHSDIFVWVGQEVEPKNKLNALNMGEKFLVRDFLHEKLSPHAPMYIVTEGNEPAFFTRFFTWDSRKSAMHGNSFQRKLNILQNGASAFMDKPRRRMPASITGRADAPEKPKRSRSVSGSTERVRPRGRSPAFTALASNFENPNRNLSTPPPIVRSINKPVTPEANRQASRSAAIEALTSALDNPAPSTAKSFIFPRSVKASHEVHKLKNEEPKAVTKKEGEGDDDEGHKMYPYERIRRSSTDPVGDIDVTKRETYLSSEEFKEKFGLTKSDFYKLPKWKQNKLKVSLDLF